ncbi:NPC intracellular cholesterol transporter 1-like isoform X2 [Haliotis rubra]|uniref:NPC intracellular cholesterol transporter 1-like isoform X2 n=1 Tax=Haliotis rubra TaxID=36100 RepID=UPI001EE631DD|nr:NPC intracellular cholesterol transporter 1-like isoform X2 [Haliotis rubra]
MTAGLNWAIRCVFCFLLLFVTESVCKDHRQATPAGHGQCVMYGMCGVNPNTGKPVPCAYTGPSKPLTDPTARRVLEEWCPDFSHDTNTCCDAHQLSWLQSMLTVPDQILVTCPACNYNFRNVFCNMVCSPKQSDFVAVTSTSSQSVTAIKYDVTTTFVDGMYKSCKDVTMPSSGGNALGLLCGWPADECSPKRLLYYLGNVRNGQSAFSIKFDVTDSPDALPGGVTLYPMNATTIPCSSPVGKRSRCSCRDCGAVPCPTTTVAPIPAYPCTKSQKGGIQKAPGYASLHLLIQRLGNHSRIKHFYPPPSLQSIMFQAVFEKAFLHQILDLQTKIQTLSFTVASISVTLDNICLHDNVTKHCTVPSVLQYFQNSNRNVDKKVMDPSGFFIKPDYLDHLLLCFRYPQTT